MLETKITFSRFHRPNRQKLELPSTVEIAQLNQLNVSFSLRSWQICASANLWQLGALRGSSLDRAIRNLWMTLKMGRPIVVDYSLELKIKLSWGDNLRTAVPLLPFLSPWFPVTKCRPRITTKMFKIYSKIISSLFYYFWGHPIGGPN